MRYRLVNDDSGHDYIIPADCEEEWDKWINSETWESGDVPEWAIACNSSPQCWTFTDPKCDFD